MAFYPKRYDSRLSFESRVSPTVVLIAICMIFFVVLASFRAFSYLLFPQGEDITAYFNAHILSLFALSSQTSALLSRPWTFLVHPFVHTGIWPLLANMLWLWVFAHIFTDLTGNRKLVPVFLYGAWAGAVAYLVFGRWMPGVSYFYGAAPGVMAICVAATAVAPKYKLFPFLSGGISLWIISIIYIVIDLASVPVSNPAVYMAHLAGGLAGFLFIFLLRKGFDGGEWMSASYDWVMNLFNPDKPKKKRDVKNMLFYKAQGSQFVKSGNLTQQKLDEILDKINMSGYDNLSEPEKEMLRRAAEEELKN
ncbi:MAG: rhomboid family intramembrane serine protease [Niabella sp.]